MVCTLQDKQPALLAQRNAQDATTRMDSASNAALAPGRAKMAALYAKRAAIQMD